MKVYLSLGSNLGGRREFLKKAIQELNQLSDSFSLLRVSPVYETPALLPKKALQEWSHPYLNLVAEFEYEERTPSCQKGHPSSFNRMTQEEKEAKAFSLLRQFKGIEKGMGVKEKKRGAPRVIDIDILLWEGFKMSSLTLSIPHRDLTKRSFFLNPLKDLRSHLDPHFFSPSSEPVLESSFFKGKVLNEVRQKKKGLPLWMAIFNFTPDSFSDGGEIGEGDLLSFEKKLKAIEEEVHILDIGGESTRPGAEPQDSKEEWKRIAPFLKFLKNRYQGDILKPLISVDTRHARTAEKALEWGVDWINDVSGLKDPYMLSLLKENLSFNYVLTHSLSVPVDPQLHLSPSEDPVLFLKNWCLGKLKFLEKEGLDLNRFIFDPGIGFGKTALQSLEILRRIDEFHSLPLRILVGASRKSFMNAWTSEAFKNRDVETLGVSLWLASQSVDILRVHHSLYHIRAFKAWSHVGEKEYLDI